MSADYHAFKLMQEIAEIQQEIELKQNMINHRMKLLHTLNN